MKTNPVLKQEIASLEEAARKNDAPVYRDVAASLKKATRKQTEVNIGKIQRNTEDGDTVIVPGKVLGSGYLDNDVTVAAFQFSNSAREAIEENGEALYIEDLLDRNPEGNEIKLLK